VKDEVGVLVEIHAGPAPLHDPNRHLIAGRAPAASFLICKCVVAGDRFR